MQWKPVLLLLFLLLGGQQLCAQSGYYWSQNYGLRSTLLCGASIAGSEDNGSIYYNPASVSGLADKTRFSLSGFSGLFYIVNNKNGAGEGTNLNFQRYEAIPKVVALSIRPFKKSETTSLFAGLYKRNFYNVEFQSLLQTNSNFLLHQNDQESLTGQFEYSDRIAENWLIMGAAHQFNNNIAIGGSIITALQQRNYRFAYSKELRTASNNLHTFISEDLTFWHKMQYNFLGKIGLSWQNKGYKIGLTYSTPTIRFRDRAQISYSKLEWNETDTALQTFNYVNNKLNGNYRLPHTVGLGIEIPIKQLKISFSAEYFHQITDYALIDRKVVTDPEQSVVRNYADRVVNAAIGFEYHFRPKNVYLLGGARTNFTNHKSQTASSIFQLQNLKAPVYHISMGTLFNYKKHVFSLGLDYGFGSQYNAKGFIDLTNINFGNLTELQPNSNNIISSHLITFVVGYEIYRSKKE